jgi:hypothetical protein
MNGSVRPIFYWLMMIALVASVASVVLLGMYSPVARAKGAQVAPSISAAKSHVSDTTQELRRKLRMQAPLQIIQVTPSGSTSKSIPHVAAMARAIAQATSGRYVPASISVTSLAYGEEMVCSDRSDAASVQRLQDFVRPYANSAAVTVIALNAPGCLDQNTLVAEAGYAPQSGFAVVTASGYAYFSHAMVHELGHMAGLEHAADGSVMSSVVTPANSAVTFSSADLQTIFG